MIKLSTSRRRAFTLIELLVVIAIICLLAAILFPVFSQAREKARQSACVSNMKQVLTALLQYSQDNDEDMPIAYNQANMFGPADASANTAALKPCTDTSGNYQACGGVDGQPNAIQAELQPYAKSYAIFACPDDHSMSTPAEVHAAANATSLGTYTKTAATPANGINLVGMTYAQAWGTSYQFGHQSFTNPYTLKTVTGYATDTFCASTANTDLKSSCEVQAGPGDQVVNGIYVPGSQASVGPSPSTTYGFAVVNIAQFSRPSETKFVHEWNTSFVDKTTTYPFHTGGTTCGFPDGHARFYVKDEDYQSGCDGLDWAWDTPGSCNIRGLQRGTS